MDAEIGERLRAFRQALGCSQEELASRLQVPLRTYQNYDQGRSAPKAHALKHLADLGINIHWLLTGEGVMLMASAGPSSPTASPALDMKLMGLILEDVFRVYAEEGARIDHRHAGEMAAAIYEDVMAACAGTATPATLTAARRMAAQQLRRRLRSTDPDTQAKRRA